MKGNEKLIEALNRLLSQELAAINQYTVHAEMVENWGYSKLHKDFWARTMDEMRHAEKLIARILFLEGTPVVDRLAPINIGSAVDKQLRLDLNAEMQAISDYNSTIKLCLEVGDSATKELLEEILLDEDRHVDDIEAKQDQIGQMGLQLFLGHYIKKEE